MLAKKWLVLFALPLLAGLVLACGGKSGGADQGIKIEEATGGVALTPGAPVATLATLATAPGRWCARQRR